MNPGDEICLRLTLHYDGTNYFGWQVQPDTPTVQGTIEDAIQRLTGERRTVLAAGRTDRGVHATGQVGSVRVPANWSSGRFRTALNAVLPGDIWVEHVRRVAGEFHPRYDAVERTYAYRMGTQEAARSPFVRPYCWPLATSVHRGLLDQLAEELLGEHRFGRFAKSGQPERGERCTVTRSEWRTWGTLGLEYWIAADRFLRHMVRYLVGTMVEIARGRRPQADMSRLLAGAEGAVTSPPAPAEGLYLVRVSYPDEAEAEGARESSPAKPLADRKR